jgi:hypothetical protein|tara:strand:- start:497 stop:793 length:297 start_codon:yes stop_codon:yes gene_type:complete
MKVKHINKKVDELLIQWLKKILPNEEHKKINTKNIKNVLPKEEYIQKNRTYYLSLYTQRWAKQNIKKLLKQNYKLDDIQIKDLEQLARSKIQNSHNTL